MDNYYPKSRLFTKNNCYVIFLVQLNQSNQIQLKCVKDNLILLLPKNTQTGTNQSSRDFFAALGNSCLYVLVQYTMEVSKDR